MIGRETIGHSAKGCIKCKHSSSVCTVLHSVILILVSCAIVTGDSSCHTCGFEAFSSLQTSCKSHLTSLGHATLKKNYTEVCKTLVDTYICGGQYIPQCLTNLTRLYASYHSTPYDCHITNDVQLQLQKFRQGITCATTEPPAVVTTESSTTPKLVSIIVDSSTSSYDKHAGVNSAQTLSGFLPSLFLSSWTFLLLYNSCLV